MYEKVLKKNEENINNARNATSVERTVSLPYSHEKKDINQNSNSNARERSSNGKRRSSLDNEKKLKTVSNLYNNGSKSERGNNRPSVPPANTRRTSHGISNNIVNPVSRGAKQQGTKKKRRPIEKTNAPTEQVLVTTMKGNRYIDVPVLPNNHNHNSSNPTKRKLAPALSGENSEDNENSAEKDFDDFHGNYNGKWGPVHNPVYLRQDPEQLAQAEVAAFLQKEEIYPGCTKNSISKSSTESYYDENVREDMKKSNSKNSSCNDVIEYLSNPVLAIESKTQGTMKETKEASVPEKKVSPLSESAKMVCKLTKQNNLARLGSQEDIEDVLFPQNSENSIGETGTSKDSNRSRSPVPNKKVLVSLRPSPQERRSVPNSGHKSRTVGENSASAEVKELASLVSNQGQHMHRILSQIADLTAALGSVKAEKQSLKFKVEEAAKASKETTELAAGLVSRDEFELTKNRFDEIEKKVDVVMIENHENKNTLLQTAKANSTNPQNDDVALRKRISDVVDFQTKEKLVDFSKALDSRLKHDKEDLVTTVEHKVFERTNLYLKRHDEDKAASIEIQKREVRFKEEQLLDRIENLKAELNCVAERMMICEDRKSAEKLLSSKKSSKNAKDSENLLNSDEILSELSTRLSKSESKFELKLANLARKIDKDLQILADQNDEITDTDHFEKKVKSISEKVLCNSDKITNSIHDRIDVKIDAKLKDFERNYEDKLVEQKISTLESTKKISEENQSNINIISKNLDSANDNIKQNLDSICNLAEKVSESTLAHASALNKFANESKKYVDDKIEESVKEFEKSYAEVTEMVENSRSAIENSVSHNLVSVQDNQKSAEEVALEHEAEKSALLKETKDAISSISKDFVQKATDNLKSEICDDLVSAFTKIPMAGHKLPSPAFSTPEDDNSHTLSNSISHEESAKEGDNFDSLNIPSDYPALTAAITGSSRTNSKNSVRSSSAPNVSSSFDRMAFAQKIASGVESVSSIIVNREFSKFKKEIVEKEKKDSKSAIQSAMTTATKNFIEKTERLLSSYKKESSAEFLKRSEARDYITSLNAEQIANRIFEKKRNSLLNDEKSVLKKEISDRHEKSLLNIENFNDDRFNKFESKIKAQFGNMEAKFRDNMHEKMLKMVKQNVSKSLSDENLNSNQKANSSNPLITPLDLENSEKHVLKQVEKRLSEKVSSIEVAMGKMISKQEKLCTDAEKMAEKIASLAGTNF